MARATVEPPTRPRYAFGTDDEEITDVSIERVGDDTLILTEGRQGSPYLHQWGADHTGAKRPMVFGDRLKDEWFTCWAFQKRYTGSIPSTLTVVMTLMTKETERSWKWT